ncbi:MAG: hypothetical protein JJE17_11790 [Peptostreptococcaceae bacterium]|nr:hypothetical protein [Peptostreptococcaceae bacterium]
MNIQIFLGLLAVLATLYTPFIKPHFENELYQKICADYTFYNFDDFKSYNNSLIITVIFPFIFVLINIAMKFININIALLSYMLTVSIISVLIYLVFYTPLFFLGLRKESKMRIERKMRIENKTEIEHKARIKEKFKIKLTYSSSILISTIVTFLATIILFLCSPSEKSLLNLTLLNIFEITFYIICSFFPLTLLFMQSSETYSSLLCKQKCMNIVLLDGQTFSNINQIDIVSNFLIITKKDDTTLKQYSIPMTSIKYIEKAYNTNHSAKKR